MTGDLWQSNFGNREERPGGKHESSTLRQCLGSPEWETEGPRDKVKEVVFWMAVA